MDSCTIVTPFLGRQNNTTFLGIFSFEEGSPWSASEPSIEPEGVSTAGVEENYHRNMSWLHVSRNLRRSPEINFF